LKRLVKFWRASSFGSRIIQIFWAVALPANRFSNGAKTTIAILGSLQKLAEASIEELSLIKGIGLAKATQIKAVFEIGRRIASQSLPYKSKDLSEPKKVYELIKSKLKDYHKEHFYMIALK